jgi:anti-sigma-K factor RskA
LNDHAELRDLAAIAALGALDAGDAERLRAHRAGCAGCTAFAGEAAAASLALALAEAAVEPSQELRARVMASIASESRGERAALRAPPRSGRSGRSRLGRLALAASLAAALAGAGIAARLSTDLGRERLRVDRLMGDVETARARADALGRDLARVQAAYDAATAERVVLVRAIETVGARAAIPFDLAATPDAPAARARGFVAPAEHRGVLIARDLPAPPSGRDYQLWVLRDGVPESAGVLSAAALRGEPHTFEVAPARGGKLVLAVTIEPAGGLPAPSGPIVLASR